MSESNATPTQKGSDEKYCHECGAVIRAKAEICPKCGVRQIVASGSGLPITPSGKSKLAAALFAFFLGGLGIHKFYLGRVVWGVVYLVFCWTLIPSLIGLVEGIIYLTMSDDAFAQKYG
ncbi:MAG: NINE protein [Alphaproteobacteria bacterium]|nr:NINE protein [Alphaproteobacteria bacterium]